MHNGYFAIQATNEDFVLLIWYCYDKKQTYQSNMKCCIPKCARIFGHLKHVFHYGNYNHFYNPAYMLQLNIYLESSRKSKFTFPVARQTNK